MGCCIAIVLVIATVRRAYFKLFPSRAPVVMAFAPPARRPAPGEAPLPQARVTRPAKRRRRITATNLAGPALGLAAYAATVLAVTTAGLLDTTRPTPVWVATAAIAAAFAAPRKRPPIGDALIAAGITWFVASELDAHVLHAVGHADLLHAPGPFALSIGLALRWNLLPLKAAPAPSPTH